MERCKAERRWDKEGYYPGNSSGARHRKYRSPKSARKESQNLLNDYEVYKKRMEELMEEIEEILSEIPYVDKLLEISGGGIKTVNCFIAEVGDIGRFDNPK